MIVERSGKQRERESLIVVCACMDRTASSFFLVWFFGVDQIFIHTCSIPSSSWYIGSSKSSDSNRFLAVEFTCHVLPSDMPSKARATGS